MSKGVKQVTAIGIMKYEIPATHGEHKFVAPEAWQPVNVTILGTGVVSIWAEVPAPAQGLVERTVKVYAPNQSHDVSHHEIYLGAVYSERFGHLFLYEQGEQRA